MGTITGRTPAGGPLVGRCCAGAFLRPWPCVISYSKLVNHAHQRLIASRLAAASGPPPPSSLPAELEVEAEVSDIPAQLSSETTMVRVIFQLQKACVFGQHFFVVGEDPALGSWDPVQAVPLVWSDGHLWSAETRLPVGKRMLFKFVLKGSTGELTWQPGPDRFLDTRETNNCIVVSEDWDNAELQKITEENILEQTTVPLVLSDIEEGVAQDEEVISLEEDEEVISLEEDEEVIPLEEDEETVTTNKHQRVLVPGLISANSSITQKAAEDVEIIESVPAEDVEILESVPAEDVEILESVPSGTYVEATEVTTLKENEELMSESEKSSEPLYIFKPDDTDGDFVEKEELMKESEKSSEPLHISKPDDTDGDFEVSMDNQSPEGDQATEEAPFPSDVQDVQWNVKFLMRFILKLLSGIIKLTEPAK